MSQPPTIAVVLGTRPEAIKLAPVILALRARSEVQCHVCLTGQHRQLVDPILAAFGIKPETDLKLMEPNQSLARLTARTLGALDGFLAEHQPALVLAQGDTTTVLCAALAAFYLRVPFGHVEAGLRTGNLNAPWPEEANRVLTSRLARVHFAPTARARDHLLREGAVAGHVHVTGNTVVDALQLTLTRVRSAPPRIASLPPELQPVPAAARSADAERSLAPLVLITGHRRENLGDGFKSICEAVSELARLFPGVQFVYPVHLNPEVRAAVSKWLSNGNGRGIRPNVHLIEPLDYVPFVALMDRSKLILTDSGGVQEEAPSLGKPVLVMRETTERPEAIEAGTVRLVGTDFARIVSSAAQLLNDRREYDRMARAHNPYGDGQASARIVEHCLNLLSAARS